MKILIYFNFVFSSVMSYPAEGVEGTYKNHIDSVRSYLDSRHSERYAIFNLSQRKYNIAKLVIVKVWLFFKIGLLSKLIWHFLWLFF